MSEPTASLDVALAHASRLLQVDPALAGEQAAEILQVVADQPQALLLLAASYTARGNPTRALEILVPLATAQPDWAPAQLELGIALGRAGRAEAALEALQRTVTLQPELPQAWLALGDHLAAIGDAAAADAAYSSHIRYSSRDPALLRAGAALADGRIAEAEALLRAHLRRRPTDVAAIRMLAEVAARLGRSEDAQHLLARCLALAPSFHAARHHYALVLHRGNRPRAALAQIDMLLHGDPANPGYRNLKAVVLCRIGDYAPALALYAGILAQYPRQGRIWLSYGHALKTAGQQAQAVDAYRKSIALEPGFGEAWWSLANLKTVRFDAADVQAMRAQLQQPRLAAEHRFHLEFALGKALEDDGEHAMSFVHYQNGNAQRRALLPYDAEDAEARMAHVRQVYSADYFAARAGFGASAPDPIFIVGLPRAGSTLIEQILSSHSAVEGTMELPEIIATARALRRQGGSGDSAPYHDVLAGLDAAAVRKLGEQYLARTRVHRKTDAPLFIDKMPNNFVHIGLIQLALPNARIIDARRHPLACCFSAFKQHFARGQNFSYGLEDLGRYYRSYVELMAHFDTVLPGRIYRVHYEAMVTDTEAEVRRLLAYCGLPYQAQCLRFFENARPVRTASSEQVRRPINRDGLDQWRHYEPWLGPLKAALGPVLDAYPGIPAFTAGDSATMA